MANINRGTHQQMMDIAPTITANYEHFCSDLVEKLIRDQIHIN